MIYSLIPNIERNPIFWNVPHDHTVKYLNESTVSVKDFPSDTEAYSSKSEKKQVAFILSGAARVYVGSGDEKALIRTLNEGDIFGIANLYDEEPFPSQIFTVTDATILFIDESQFKEFIENDCTATKNYMSFLSKKIVFLNKKIATLTAGSAERKLAAHISEHQVNGIFKTSSLSELANMLQMGRASLYRAIDSLIDNGAIIKEGKTFAILDETKLKNI